ncbi:MAG TPA: MarR family transcriptional regulator [Verrucomicrobiae bacterium]|nr:MarR family transcriptional regulator [Verrucomicrobiae bacterium]
MSELLPALGATIKALRARMDAALRERGLRLGQYQLLRVLWERDALTPRELAEQVGVEMPTVTRTVQRMVRDGLVHREANADDARSVRIVLTSKGRAMESVALDVLAQTTRAALAGIPSQESDRVAQTLERILANLAG